MKKFIFNTPLLKERRKDLRNNATEPEQLLWQKLKRKQLGEKFIRQYSVGPYILDFYCPSKKLAIELDGSQHTTKDAQKYDHERTLFLNDWNIKVLRFWNSEVSHDLKSVCNKIHSALQKL